MRPLVLIALSLVCAAGAAAQDRTIPRDLVLGLLAHQMPFDTTQRLEILVGKLPEKLPIPNLNLPVIGSVQYDDATMIVYRVEGDLNSAHDRVRGQLRTAGWREPHGEQLPDVGFVGTAGDFSRYLPMCKKEGIVMIQTATIRSDLRVLKVDYNAMDGCGGSDTEFISASGGLTRSREQTPLPKLEPPANAQVFGAPIPGGLSSFSTSAYIVSDLSTSSILAHYDAQMKAKGWESRGRTTLEPTSVQSWRITNDGKEWLASLTATQLPERRHIVEINVFDLTKLGR